MATEPDLFVGKEPATFEFEGSPVFIGPAIVVRAGHPIMLGREDLFTPLVVHYDVAVAQDEPVQGEPKTTRTSSGRKQT
jgi:hypothetical protein